MTDSQRLLAEYTATGSERAFQELVARYVDLVYSTAVRLVDGDTHRARDVAQTVFVDLARMAGRLSSNTLLGGWLHQHTCFVARTVMRGERRRQARERQAAEMSALEHQPDQTWADLAPLLDEAILKPSNRKPPRPPRRALFKHFLLSSLTPRPASPNPSLPHPSLRHRPKPGSPHRPSPLLPRSSRRTP